MKAENTFAERIRGVIMEEYEEYTVFTTKTGDGREVEMAILDEFEFENKNYVAAALVEGDTINEDGMYIYRAKNEDGEFVVEKIHSQVEYQRIADAYMEYLNENDDDSEE